MRFSGHESFPLRYAWLPKAYRAVKRDGASLLDDERAMVELGVGKNMVRSIRFWTLATGVVEPADGTGYRTTAFGDAILGECGLDPFLEDTRTLWLLHWRLCQNVEDPIFAWDYLLNRWHLPDLSASKVLPVMEREAEIASGRSLSPITLAQHLDVFLRTYVPARGYANEVAEDSLDSPLAELELIRQVGERPTGESGRREPVYAFRREPKPDITPRLFIYCLADFWRLRHRSEQTLSFREIAVGRGGPGQVFKLPEDDLRERLDSVTRDSDGLFAFRESGAEPRLTRLVDESDDRWMEGALLSAVYEEAAAPLVTHG